MDEYYNKHYIKPDSSNRIIGCWSDGPHPDRDTTDAICISDKGGYQFRFTPDGERRLQQQAAGKIFWRTVLPKWLNRYTTYDIRILAGTNIF